MRSLIVSIAFYWTLSVANAIEWPGSVFDCKPDQLKSEIAAGLDLGMVDDQKNTLLHWAARNACTKCVKILLENGMKINSQNLDGETPFMTAVVGGSSDEQAAYRTVQALAKAGADTSIPNRFGYSPLFALMVYGDRTTSITVDPEQLKPDPKTGIPAYRESEYKVAKLLLELGADPTETDTHGQSLMHFAVERRTPATIDLLVSNGADLNVKTPPENRSMLHLAVQRKRALNIPYLLKQGLDIDGRDKNGATPLMLAVANKHIATTKLLLEHGADTEEDDRKGYTPLIFAASKFDHGSLRLLLEAGADPDAQTHRSKITALQLLARHGLTESVQLLLEHGVDADLPNKTGATPEILARNNGHTRVVNMLQNYERPNFFKRLFGIK